MQAMTHGETPAFNFIDTILYLNLFIIIILMQCSTGRKKMKYLFPFITCQITIAIGCDQLFINYFRNETIRDSESIQVLDQYIIAQQHWWPALDELFPYGLFQS